MHATMPASNARRVPRSVDTGRNVQMITKMCASDRERGGKSRDELDQIGLTAGAGLFKQAADMGLDRGVRNAKLRRDLGYAANFDNGEQHPQLRRRQ